jgi:hypothetical protein
LCKVEEKTETKPFQNSDATAIEFLTNMYFAGMFFLVLAFVKKNRLSGQKFLFPLLEKETRSNQYLIPF